jgi:hypothetical protein
MEANKSYDKYYVKKNPSTNEILNDDGKPILGELAKRDCRLEPRHVKVLNRGWQQSGVYFKEVKKETPITKPPKEKSEARLALEKEASDLGINFNPKIGDAKLQLKINEKKA